MAEFVVVKVEVFERKTKEVILRYGWGGNLAA